jgi:hypothetical protein
MQDPLALLTEQEIPVFVKKGNFFLFRTGQNNIEAKEHKSGKI